MELKNMNNVQIIVYGMKMYITGIVIEKSVRAFGCNNRADIIKGFTVISCGCCILLIFCNSANGIKDFSQNFVYYLNPVNFLKGLGDVIKDGVFKIKLF